MWNKTRVIVGLVVLVAFLLPSVIVVAGPWEEVAPINVGRVKSRAVVVEDKIFLIGGEDVEEGIAPVEVYDSDTNSWSVVGPSPDNGIMPCLGAVDKKIYVLSGETSDAAGGEIVRYGYVWDTTASDTPQWERVPGKSSMGHSDAGCAVIGERIYLVSGEDDTLTNEGSDYVRTVDVFDTVTQEWSTADPITPHQRQDFDVIGAGSRIVVIGGQGGKGDAPLNWVDVYSPLRGWKHFEGEDEEAAPFPWEHPRIAAVEGDELFVLTGKGEGGFVNYRYHILDQPVCPTCDETEYWEEKTPPPVPVYEGSVVAMNEQIYVIGGEDLAGNLTTKVWRYNP